MKDSKKIILFLALAMIITFIPAVSETVHAETVMQPPTSNTYIEGSEFADADMNYGLTTGKTPQAVYFGTNGEPYTNYSGRSRNGGSPANELNPNHYVASGIRSILNDLATDESYFTQAEQAMMKETTGAVTINL